jgi:elongation factor 1-beta
MADVIVTMKIMPTAPDVNLIDIQNQIKTIIETNYKGKTGVFKEVPIAFGLKSLVFSFAVDEKKGGTEPIEEDIKQLEGVENVEVTGVTRALG